MRARRLAFILGLLAGASSFSPASAAVHSVTVHSNYYDAEQLRIAKGDTVVWTAVNGGHTVTAEDGRFDFYERRTLSEGETVQHTFSEDATVRYHCRVHAGMVGVVIVGTGRPPCPDCTNEPEIRRVPEEYATVQKAVDGAPAGSIVEVAPGEYREKVIVSANDVTIRGTGSTPGAVTMQGDGGGSIGLRVVGSGVRIENLTTIGYGTGILFDRAEHFLARGIVAAPHSAVSTPMIAGIRAVGSRGGAIRDTLTSGASSAGIAIEECDACGIVVDGAESRGNFVGLLGRNARGIVVRNSAFRGNATGIVLRTSSRASEAPQAGAHVYQNLFESNTATNVARPPRERALDDVAANAGVWLAGAWLATVERNVIVGHEYGILVSALDAPSYGNRIVNNTLSGSREADLAWDGLGVNTCFSGNRTADSKEPASSPVLAQAVYACSLPATVGVPNPIVTAAVARALIPR